MWELYDALLDGIRTEATVTAATVGPGWTVVETSDGGMGFAMTTRGSTRPRRVEKGCAGLPLRRAAELIQSWNLTEASIGMAVINAFYNSHARMLALRAAQPHDKFCTFDVTLDNRTIGVIGHLRMPPGTLDAAREVYILERHPQEGDYPDSACESLLPQCDLVLITGSALTNKTMPRLLKLAEHAQVILAGPSVPLCPALFPFGIFRLTGFVATEREKLRSFATEGGVGPPYPWGRRFSLEVEHGSLL